MRDDHLEELERAIAQALVKIRELAAQNALPPVLQPLNLIAPPRGFTVQVQLTPYTDHARPEQWSRDSRWDARNGEVSIAYEPSRDEPQRDERAWQPDDRRGATTSPDPQTALRDVIRVVARAEDDPAFSFLALKFLRDQLLPRQVAWASLPHEAQIQINYAIDQGILITGKVENPRTPQYPVTAVKLNREHPLVVEVLGPAAAGEAAPPSEDSAAHVDSAEAEAGAEADGDREPA